VISTLRPLRPVGLRRNSLRLFLPRSLFSIATATRLLGSLAVISQLPEPTPSDLLLET
jgi:hypothetical protein